MFNKNTLSVIAFAIIYTATANAQLYKNPKAPVEKRVADLMKRMTLEEKVGQMNMSSLSEAKNSKIAYGVLESPFVTAREVAEQSILAKRYSRLQSRLESVCMASWPPGRRFFHRPLPREVHGTPN